MGPYNNEFVKQADSRGHMWHPGVKGHQMRAHSIAYAFLGTMGVALEGMLTAMKVKISNTNTLNKNQRTPRSTTTTATMTTPRPTTVSGPRASKIRKPDTELFNSRSKEHVLLQHEHEKEMEMKMESRRLMTSQQEKDKTETQINHRLIVILMSFIIIKPIINFNLFLT